MGKVTFLSRTTRTGLMGLPRRRKPLLSIKGFRLCICIVYMELYSNADYLIFSSIITGFTPEDSQK